MKRINLLFALLAIILLGFILGCDSSGGLSEDGSGSGTVSDPFIVSSETTLRKVGTDTDGWRYDSHYIMTANIDLTSRPNWRPINNFNGTFDGNGHTITGLTINDPSIGVGLFSSIHEGGIVKNLGLVNVSIYGENCIGGVAGFNLGTIQNCYSTGSVSGLTEVGGVVGDNRGTVQNSHSTANVSGSEDWGAIGGVVGINSDSVQNCYSTGSVSGIRSVGGVVGDNRNVVLNCYSTGNVSGENRVGGVVGSSIDIVQNCVALNPTISRTTGSETFFSLVVGYSSGTLTNNRARSDMTLINVTPYIPVSSNGPSTVHGANVAVNNTVPLSTVFAGWDTSIWNIPSGNLSVNGALPTLRNVGGSQNPTLPAIP